LKISDLMAQSYGFGQRSNTHAIIGELNAGRIESLKIVPKGAVESQRGH
jgi:hypothetical protein